MFGSGETSPSGRKIFDRVMRELPPEPRLALLETPAGFELNSDRVIGRVADFLRHKLQNYRPPVEVVPARMRGTPLSPDDSALAAPLLEADLIFMGPGSPSYAVRQLKDSQAWYSLLARHRLGAVLALASAAAVAIGRYALPVYEIYKAGEDLHWKAGLDLFGLYGLPLIFIPHWNNNDGGEELDTSRCFMGQSRFARLMAMLPPDLTVLGIDEMTALTMEIREDVCRVMGLGGVTLIHTGHAPPTPGPDLSGTGLAEVAALRHGHVHRYQNGETFPLSECCPFEAPTGGEGLPPAVWERALQADASLKARRQADAFPNASARFPAETLPAEVSRLVEARQAARLRKDWAAADSLRVQLAGQGWQVLDTPEGPRVERIGGKEE